MKVNLKFVSKKHIDFIYTAINEILFDFPILYNYNIIIHMKLLNKNYKESFASHRLIYGKHLIQEIKLNPKIFLFSNIENKFKSVYEANYETVKDIIWHELGHCLQIAILCNFYNLNLTEYSKNKKIFFNHLENKQTNRICYKQHMDYWFSKFNWDYTKANYFLGSYAIKYPEEFIPECFNNYYRLRTKSFFNNTEQETYQFVSTVINNYKNYIKINEINL